MWSFDLERTENRFSDLNSYYSAQGLRADDFSCSHYRECECSTPSDCSKQYAGGTAALMPFYDANYAGQDVRILIVGKENGYSASSEFGTARNFRENSTNFYNCINWKKKNNHMKGNLVTLAHIYGFHSEYLFAAYAASNGLKCGFQKAGKLENVSGLPDTKVMRENCSKHLVKEIEILEPTIVICQGEWATKNKTYLRRKLIDAGFGNGMRNGPSAPRQYGLYGFNHFQLLLTHHPAIFGHWKMNLAPVSLFPMLDYLKETGFLPKIDANTSAEFLSKVKGPSDRFLDGLPSNDLLRTNRYQAQTEFNF